MAFIYINHIRKSKSLDINAKIIGCVLVIIDIVFFGFLGDKRMISSGYTDEKEIFKIDQADPVFDYVSTGFLGLSVCFITNVNLIEQELSNNYNKGKVLDFILGAILPCFV
ncbi:hypothetical protein [Citrobacter sp. R56]|uniref:hypothetical protein n=1 Tax=Citrobacter sp. R56 TaxID=1573676 RepID=UPI001EEF62C8|nr:hypothetical protein [Citrobacter sp. R56]